MFKSAIDLLSVKITAAQDGGKKAIAERNHQEQVVIKMMRQLSRYAEDACKDDMTTFLKSGFQATSTVKSASSPLSAWIRTIRQGKKGGQISLSLGRIGNVGPLPCLTPGFCPPRRDLRL